MAMNTNTAEFSIGFGEGRCFHVAVRDLMSAPVDAIVNPANSGLSHGGGLAAIISQEAGPALDAACERIIAKIGKVPVSLAVPTCAGDLPYKGVIHAVGPWIEDEDIPGKLAATIQNAMLLADRKGWQSLAFPAISTGIFGVSKDLCALAFGQAVPAFWEQNPASSVSEVWLCLTVDDFDVFKANLYQASTVV